MSALEVKAPARGAQGRGQASAAAAAAVMHTDVVFADMALRTQVIGRTGTTRDLLLDASAG